MRGFRCKVFAHNGKFSAVLSFVFAVLKPAFLTDYVSRDLSSERELHFP